MGTLRLGPFHWDYATRCSRGACTRAIWFYWSRWGRDIRRAGFCCDGVIDLAGEGAGVVMRMRWGRPAAQYLRWENKKMLITAGQAGARHAAPLQAPDRI